MNRFAPRPSRNEKAKYFKALTFLNFLKTLRYQFETCTLRKVLLIHHGGYGSCQTGLFTGTPTLAIPTFSERESNARRIAAVGAGDFVLPTADVSGRKKHAQQRHH